jgi:hypothetical protein
VDQSAPSKILSGDENFVLQALQFYDIGVCANFKAGQA